MSFDNHGIPDEILDGIFAEEDTERGQMKAKQNARLEDSYSTTGSSYHESPEIIEKTKLNQCSCQLSKQN